MSFAGTENYEFFKELEAKLKDFNPKIRSGKGGGFDVAFKVDSKNMNAPIIPQMLKAYMDEFHK